MAAAESPKSRNRPKTPVKNVTIPTMPKSLGSRSRANTTRELIRNKKLAPWAHSLARPPRIVFPFRSCIVFSDYQSTKNIRKLFLERSFLGRGEIATFLGRLRRLRWRCAQHPWDARDRAPRPALVSLSRGVDLASIIYPRNG